MLSCHDIADYFLVSQDEESGELISNLKLQKLMYYAQGFHLALYGTMLFPNDIEAWAHGPVVPELYHKFKGHGSAPLPRPENIALEKFNAQTRELLDDVINVYGQYSGWKLRNMTHEEAPWIESKPGVIHPQLMADYFKSLLAA